MSAELEPFRTALLADARAVADAILADARARARQTEARAAARCAAIEEAARREGMRAGELEEARRRAELRRAQRKRVLRARRDAYDHLRGEAQRAVARLRAEPDYRRLEDRLAAFARGRLGDAAAVVRDPGGVGGVRATQGARTLDLTLPHLAERCLDELDVEIGEVLG